MTIDECFQALAYLTVAILFATIVGTVIMSNHLKRNFPTTWQAEGSPDKWLTLQTCATSGHVLGFLDEQRYLATNEFSFIRFCHALRMLWRIALITIGITLVAGVVWAITKG